MTRCRCARCAMEKKKETFPFHVAPNIEIPATFGANVQDSYSKFYSQPFKTGLSPEESREFQKKTYEYITRMINNFYLGPFQERKMPTVTNQAVATRQNIHRNASYSVNYTGPPYLAIPWPVSCPWTSEEVIAACDVRRWQLVSIPFKVGYEWLIKIQSPMNTQLTTNPLTQDFINAAKCKHDTSIAYGKCPGCGQVINDRRSGKERRQKLSYNFHGRRRNNPQEYPEGDRRKSQGRREGRDRRTLFP